MFLLMFVADTDLFIHHAILSTYTTCMSTGYFELKGDNLKTKYETNNAWLILKHVPFTKQFINANSGLFSTEPGNLINE